MTSFSQLQRDYSTANAFFVEVTDLAEVRRQHLSRTATSWGGGPIGGSGWVQLGHASPTRNGGQATVFVCRAGLLQRAMEDAR